MHTPETKAYALALLLAGSSVHQVSRETGVDRATIRRWWRAFRDEDAFEAVARKVSASLGPLWDFSRIS